MRYNFFQRVCVLVLIGVMLISLLPAQAMAESISAPAEVAGQVSSSKSQTPGMESEDAGSVAGDLTTGERYYLNNGLVLELNEDEKSLAVVELVNVAATSLQIPDTYAGLPVTRIGDLAFKGKTALKEVVLSDNIQHIGDDVFSGCVNLQCLEEDGARYIGSATNPHFYLLGAVNQDITTCTVSEETKIVASYAFHNCKQLTGIVIPDSVIQVGFRSLRGCDNLQSVTLPFAGETENGSVNTHVGFAFGARTYGGNISFVPTTITSLVIKRGMLQKNALYGLDSVQHLGLPSMQQPLGYYYGGETYEDNEFIPGALTSIEVADGELAEYAFYNCKNLGNILLGDGVIINGWASKVFFNTKFYENTADWPDGVLYSGNHLLSATTSIDGQYVVPEGTVSITERAFIDCSGLTGITIPDSVTRISGYAFYGCTGLNDFTIPDSVTVIGDAAFYKCTGLTEVNIGNSVISIGRSAFYGCTGLTSITIPDGVTSIGGYVFSGCTGLTSITIPDSVTVIGKYVFDQCTSLTYNVYDNARYLGNATNPYVILLESISDYITQCQIYPDTKLIYDQAFRDCERLTRITIPESVTGIGDFAFCWCTKLTRITIPDSVISIGDFAFSNCDGLRNITTPASMTSIGNNVFSDCDGLTSITIPDSVTSIGSYAFKGCTGLTSITIPDSVTSVGGSAFSGCTGLTSITIPDSVTVIGEYAFDNCTGLTEVNIGSGVTSIGNYVFSDCTGLTSITIPDSVTVIGEYAFNNCTGLIEVDMGNGVTCIGGYAFYGCDGLRSITIPSSMTSIGNYAFYGCFGLMSITIPASVTSIGDYTFFNCFRLTSITISDSVTSIGTAAFQYCNQLTAITFSGIYAQWQGISFGTSWNSGTGAYTIYCMDAMVTKSGKVTYFAEAATLEAAETDGGATATAVVEVYSEELEYTLGLEYTSNGNGTCYVSDTGSCWDAEIVIPSVSPEGDRVTSIHNYAFSHYSKLTSITIPASVISIGAGAFWRCSNLEQVVFEEGSKLQSIGSEAFAETGIGVNEGAITYPGSALAWRYIQKATDWDGGLTTWESSFAFGEEDTILYEMSDDRSEFYVGEYSGTGEIADIPEVFCGRPVTQLYEKAFFNAEGLKKVIVPDTIQHIFSNTFYNCPDLTEIAIHGKDITMEQGIIFGCEALSFLTVPFMGQSSADTDNAYLGYLFGANSYKENASYVPTGLQNVTLSNTVSVGDYAFAQCGRLEHVILSEGVTEIGGYAFSDCISLREMEIPDSVTVIGDKILDNCNNIKTIKIGSGIREIPDVAEGYALFGIEKIQSSLMSYVVSEGNPKFAADERGVLYELHDTLAVPVAVLDAPAKADLKDYQLPEHIVYIGPYAFAYNTTLRWIQLDRVRRIDKCAFMEATSLVAAVFGSEGGLDADASQYAEEYDAYIAQKHREGEVYSQIIGDQAFFGCSMLRYVNLWTDFIVSIGQEAFYDCNVLTSVRLSASVQSIGQRAFGQTALESIIVDENNTHYASIDGVLYEKLKDSYKLLLFPSCKTVTNAAGKVYQTSFQLPVEIAVSAVESYAFQNAQYLNSVTLDSTVDMMVGDYAFQNAAVQTVYIGEKVTSLGLVRGEGEYTVFESCEHLTAIDVAQGNAYYSSKGGVLFDKEQTKLIKYPYHKVGGEYTLPDTVSVIASMAFKGNKNLTNIVIPSYIHTVGLEAFYDCANLVSIYFDHVYAPTSVLENAFTTNTVAGTATRALLCYSAAYYENGGNGRLGWKNYDRIYPLYESNVTPSFEQQEAGSLFYAIVVVDSSGVPVDGAKVSLTDYNGKTETIVAAGGIAMFYDNLGNTQTDVFSIGFEDAYTVMVEDPSGKYYDFTNPALWLDEDMLITYVNLTKLPTAYGVSCNGEDINSQRLELNKANIDFTDLLFDEAGNVQYGADGKTPLFDEVVEISVIGYCDTRYAFVDADGMVLDESCGLYQNGVRIASVSRAEQEGGATIFYFRPAVADLANEVDIEVRLTAVGAGEELFCSTVLNIHVFDFFIDESQLNLDQASAHIDFGAAGEFAQMLLGGDGLDLSLGKHIKLTTSLEDDIVTFQLEGSKDLLKKRKPLNNDYEQGFNDNNKQGMKTYRFQYTAAIKDGDLKLNTLRYNISFTRETEDSDYYYYRCKIHDIGNGTRATDSNLITTFYGVVNRLDVAGMDTRSAAKIKGDLIFATHYTYVVSEGMDEDAVEAGANKARYSELVVQLPDDNQKVTTQKLELSVTGEVSFQYIGEGEFRCTGGSVKCNLVYQFNHNQQMMIWVIPVILRVEVKASGEIAITVEVDENQEVDLEMLLTLELGVTASIGVGCSVASVGFYGNIGTVFVLEILPEFGVDSWKIYGEMGAYARVMWFEYKYRFTPQSWADGYYIVAPTEEAGAEETAMLSESAYMSSLYLADSYSGTDAQALQMAYRLVVLDGELYKLCYADVSGMENYDANNYVKLALSKWNGENWSQPVIIDDNGLNDAEYMLYQANDKLMMVYTQQTQRLMDANDTYAAAQNLQIKVVELSEEMGKPVTVAQPDSYAYLTRYGVVDGVPTVVWAENADNNIFGVSPYNYIDNSGNSHVFATTANSVWASQFVGDAWTAPQCLADNLSAVTQITVSDAGDVAYIVDTNGDLTDTTDRVLYYGPVGGEMSAFNDTAKGSVKSVIADGNRFLYYYDGVSPEETDGWMSLITDAEAFPQDAPEEFELLYDGEGSLYAILYSENKNWMQSGEKKSGSAIYGRFLENGDWGNAVELSAYVPEHDRYVQKFTAVLVGEEILISASTVDSAGENAFHASGSCQLGAKLSVEVSEVDYAGQQVIYTVKNQGTASTDVYMSLGNDEYILISESALGSGASMQCIVYQPDCVSFALTQNGDGEVVAESVSLAYSNLQTNVKQVLLGANDFLLFSVRNMGNTANTGITVIRNGAYDTTTVASTAVYKAVMALNLNMGEVTAFTFVNEKGEIETAWAVKNLVEPGNVFYHELAMSEVVGNGTESLVCLYTIPETQLEPQSMEENNYACLNYGVCDGVLQAGEEADTRAVLGSNAMEYQKDAAEDLVIPFFCPQDTTVEQVRIGDVTLDIGAYTVEKLTVGGRILIPSSVLTDLSGSYVVTVVFTSGEHCQMTLKLLSRYTAVWMDGGQILQTQQLLEGTVPEFTKEMVKDSHDAWTYSFAGWDYTGDGIADTVTAIAGDVTYWAVWNTAPRAYTVQWSMLGSAGEEILVTESYLYGDIPGYLGTVFKPDGSTFAGWQGDVKPVTGDTVYTAVYESVQPLVIPTLTLTAPSLSFEDEIIYNAYFTVDDMSSVVEMGMITFNTRLTDGTIADAVDVVPGYFASGSSYSVSSNGIPAKNLGDALYFKAYAKLSDGTYAYSGIAGYNAVAYANAILGSSSYGNDIKALVVAMLNYGAAAQVQFNYKTDSLMNAGVSAANQALVAEYNKSMIDDVVKADSSKVGIFVHNGGYTAINPSVSFEGAFSINYYLSTKYTPDAAPTFYYWDAETYATADKLTIENATGTMTTTLYNGNWIGTVSGIAAKQIDETCYAAAVYTYGGTTYVTPILAYSLGSYCETIAADGNELGAATAVYGYYAAAYFNK